MGRLLGFAERVATIGAYLGGSMILAAAAVVTFEVISRKLFNFSIAGADELAGYAYALSMAWGYSYALFSRAHIRVDAVYARMPFPVRCVLDVVAFSGLTIFIAVLFYHVAGVFVETVHINSKSNTPLSTPQWIPQSVWAAGMGFFALSLVLLTIQSARALLRGDLESVRELAHGPINDGLIVGEMETLEIDQADIAGTKR